MYSTSPAERSERRNRRLDSRRAHSNVGQLAIGCMDLTNNLMTLLFAYNLCLRMTQAKADVRQSINQNGTATLSLLWQLYRSNAMRASWSTGGGVINNNFANGGILSRNLTRVHRYFYKNSLKSKARGIKSLFEILLSCQILYSVTYYLWDATFSYTENTPAHNAIQWAWGVFAMVNLQVIWKTTIRISMERWFLNETPFLQVFLNEGKDVYTIQNPRFKGEMVNQEGITTMNTVPSETWRAILHEMDRGRYIPVESKNGIIDNYYGRRSWFVRGGIGIAMSFLSLTFGYMWRLMPGNRSTQNIIISHSLAAAQDLFSVYCAFIPFVQPIIMQKLLRYCIFLDNNPGSKIKSKIVKALTTTFSTFAGYNISLFFYGWYRIFADRIVVTNIFPSNYSSIASPSFLNDTMFLNHNGTFIESLRRINGQQNNAIINDTLNESFANWNLGTAILFECFWFFSGFHGLMNSCDFFKDKPRRKAILCQILFAGMVILSISGLPIEQYIDPYFIDTAAGMLMALAGKFQFEAYSRERKERYARDRDYIDDLDREYNQTRRRSTYSPNDAGMMLSNGHITDDLGGSDENIARYNSILNRNKSRTRKSVRFSNFGLENEVTTPCSTSTENIGTELQTIHEQQNNDESEISQKPQNSRKESDEMNDKKSTVLSNSSLHYHSTDEFNPFVEKA